MPIAYIASPFRGIKLADPEISESDAIAMAKQIAFYAARYVKEELGFIPLSPVLAFDRVYNDVYERDKVMEACKALIRISDVFIWVDTRWTQASEGMKLEQAFAESIGLAVRVAEINPFAL
ncbi:MAG: DUF4406 domain-containing protein [Deferribacteraceae bacterium]|jgi:hypothetical protein|nr:DUF4406 domain-containing protein [Deferribacteraceae bacterium]